MGRNQEQRLAKVNEEREHWFSQRPGKIKLPNIRVTNCTNDGWGDLNGPAYKAAITRNAAGFFEYMASTYSTTASPKDRNLRQVTASLTAFYGTLCGGGMFLTEAEVATLQDHTTAFGLAYQRLRNLAATEGELLWPVRPKVHKMQHVPEMAGVINPVHAQCYGDESLMGTTANVWKRSMSGRCNNKIQRLS